MYVYKIAAKQLAVCVSGTCEAGMGIGCVAGIHPGAQGVKAALWRPQRLGQIAS